MNLLKRSPQSSDKRSMKKDGSSVPSNPGHDLHLKAKPASELEAQWRKEADQKRTQESATSKEEEDKAKQDAEQKVGLFEMGIQAVITLCSLGKLSLTSRESG
jgi:hypothetical protein